MRWRRWTPSPTTVTTILSMVLLLAAMLSVVAGCDLWTGRCGVFPEPVETTGVAVIPTVPFPVERTVQNEELVRRLDQLEQTLQTLIPKPTPTPGTVPGTVPTPTKPLPKTEPTTVSPTGQCLPGEPCFTETRTDRFTDTSGVTYERGSDGVYRRAVK